ncbi:MAG: PilZ domain-containing protein [Candidatus Acidiferrum sp.]|jgi:hypothetical protein
MGLEGRIEKRVGMEIPVRLLASERIGVVEKVVTVNVSPHGARVITKQRWRTGDHLGIASLAGDLRVHAKVVYCHPQGDDNFYVGLEFRRRFVDWERGV